MPAGSGTFMLFFEPGPGPAGLHHMNIHYLFIILFIIYSESCCTLRYIKYYLLFIPEDLSGAPREEEEAERRRNERTASWAGRGGHL